MKIGDPTPSCSEQALMMTEEQHRSNDIKQAFSRWIGAKETAAFEEKLKTFMDLYKFPKKWLGNGENDPNYAWKNNQISD